MHRLYIESHRYLRRATPDQARRSGVVLLVAVVALFALVAVLCLVGWIIPG